MGLRGLLGVLALLCLRGAAGGEVADLLNGLVFLNNGTVRSTDSYALVSKQSIYNEEYTYQATTARARWTTGGLSYLYKIEGASRLPPPTGMRSSVPLGGLGAGGVELRADGRIGDWGTALNNGPQAKGGGKVEHNDFMLGVAAGGAAVPFRTHPPAGVADGMEQITYQGAFPVSRLTASDPRLSGLSVQLDAFSHFEMHNENASAAPIVHFAFTVTSTKDSPTTFSTYINIPEALMGGTVTPVPSTVGKGITLTGGAGDTAGSMAVQAAVYDGDGSVEVTWGQGGAANATWGQFVSGKGVLPNKSTGKGSIAVAVSTTIPPKGSVVVGMVLGYYFPTRHWGDVDIGQFYSNLFTSAEDAAFRAVGSVKETLQAATAWQQFALSNSFPDYLRDSLVNSGGGLGKTSMWLRDGRWRQFESHSCSQMEPPHIHFYRALLYISIFPNLERQTVELYSDHQVDNGLVSELFGCGCGGCEGGSYDLDTAKGGARGDDNNLYVIDMYMNYKWTGDAGKQLLQAKWGAVKQALEWSMNHTLHNLTYHLTNTFDEHGTMGDLNSYNAFVFLTGLASGARLARSQGDDELAARLDSFRRAALQSLKKYLWVGTHYRSFWCENGQSDPVALQGDVLYGQVWGFVLGLLGDIGVDNTTVVSHLKQETAWNMNDYGIQFAVNRSMDYHCKGPSQLGVGFQDHDTWTMMAIDHSTLSVVFDAEPEPLEAARRMLNSYRELSRDQWDFRDLSSTYPDAEPSEPSRPTCNSHYTRQDIMWALPLALSGQQWDSTTGTLSFSPKAGVAKWPVLLPQGSAVAESRGDGCLRFKRLSGAPNEHVKRLLVGSTEFSLPTSLDSVVCPRK